jgi:hypothetical protein
MISIPPHLVIIAKSLPPSFHGFPATAKMLPLRHTLLYYLLSATAARAQITTTNTTVSLLIFETRVTGYMATAGPTSTTYVLDCGLALCAATTGEYARVTAAPGVQEFNGVTDDASTVHQLCRFDTTTTTADRSSTKKTTTTGATCWDTTSGAAGTWWSNVTYVPTPPATRGQDNIFTWKGLDAVLITSSGTGSVAAVTTTMGGGGVTAAAAATTTSSDSGAATGDKTNDAVSRERAGTLAYGVAALAAALAMDV